jgi:hypothetical protein
MDGGQLVCAHGQQGQLSGWWWRVSHVTDGDISPLPLI